MTMNNREPSGYVDGEIAVVNFRGTGEDRASVVTITSLSMTRHSLQTNIHLMMKLLEHLDEIETREPDVIQLRAKK